MELSQKLRSFRKQFGWTLADVTERTKLSVSFLSDVERGRTRPSLETLEVLAKLYQTSAAELVKEEDTGGLKIPDLPGLKDFLKQEMGRGNQVNEAVLEAMLHVDRRGERKARTPEDWRRLYYSLQSLMSK